MTKEADEIRVAERAVIDAAKAWVIWRNSIGAELHLENSVRKLLELEKNAKSDQG